MPHLDEGRLAALLDHELTGEEQREVEAHLATCQECHSLWQEIQAFATEADRLVATIEVPVRPSRPIPEVPAARLPTPRRPLPWRTLAWAATLVLAVGLGYSMRGFSRAERAAPDTASDKLAAGPTAAQDAPSAAQPTNAPAQGTAAALDQAPRSNALAERPAPRPPAESATSPTENAELGNASGAAKPRSEPSLAAGQNAPASPEARRDVTAPVAAAPPSRERASIDDAKALSQTAQPAAPPPGVAGFVGGAAGFRRVEMEQAVRVLDGAIRLVDGLEPTRILAGPGTRLGGADASREVIRVVYQDPPGRELWLDQQRVQALADGERGGGPRGLLPGDTILAPVAGGAQSIRWLDQHGFLLGLTGFLPADSLRALLLRVR